MILFFKGKLLLILVLWVSITCPGPAAAAWVLVHGNNGNLGFMDRVSDPNTIHRTMGLYFHMYDTTNFVHFTIPTPPGTHTAQAVRLKFYAGPLNSSVSHISIYDGPTKIKTFLGPWSGEQDLTLNLDSPYTFLRGPGISVKVASGPDSLTDKYIFHAVGLDFI